MTPSGQGRMVRTATGATPVGSSETVLTEGLQEEQLRSGGGSCHLIVLDAGTACQGPAAFGRFAAPGCRESSEHSSGPARHCDGNVDLRGRVSTCLNPLLPRIDADAHLP